MVQLESSVQARGRRALTVRGRKTAADRVSDKAYKPTRVAMITECSMADNLRDQFPAVEFIKPCNLCPHMKRITLQNIYVALRDGCHEITIDPDVIVRARAALDRMLAVGRRESV